MRQHLGFSINPVEWRFELPFRLAGFIDEIEDMYERKAGSRRTARNGIYHNLGVAGFRVRDSFTVDANYCAERICEAEGCAEGDTEYNNAIVDVSPLGNLIHLTELFLDDNAIVDVSSLANLTQLTGLSLHVNSISDISPLTVLTQLSWLVIVGNPLNADAVVHSSAMKAKGIRVRFDYRRD